MGQPAAWIRDNKTILRVLRKPKGTQLSVFFPAGSKCNRRTAPANGCSGPPTRPARLAAWGQLCEQAAFVALRRAEFNRRARLSRHGKKEMSSGIKQLTSPTTLWQDEAAKNPIVRRVWIDPTRKLA